MSDEWTGPAPWAIPVRVLERAEAEGKVRIWDPVRNKWIIETPEEVVRQQVLIHLVEDRGIAPGLIGVEKAIPYFRQKKRFDLVVFDRQAKPWMLIECKQPQVPLTDATVMQVVRYNEVFHAPHLVITNGLRWMLFSRKEETGFSWNSDNWPVKE